MSRWVIRIQILVSQNKNLGTQLRRFFEHCFCLLLCSKSISSSIDAPTFWMRLKSSSSIVEIFSPLICAGIDFLEVCTSVIFLTAVKTWFQNWWFLRTVCPVFDIPAALMIFLGTEKRSQTSNRSRLKNPSSMKNSKIDCLLFMISMSATGV